MSPVRPKPDWTSSAMKTMPSARTTRRARQEARGRHDESALALDRLDEDRRDLVYAPIWLSMRSMARRRPRSPLSPAARGTDTTSAPGRLGRERAETRLVRHVLRGQRHRQVGAAVEGVVEDDDRLPSGVDAGDLTAFSTASAPELNSAERFSWSPGVSRLSASQTAT